MTWYHLVDQNGNHWIIPGALYFISYFYSTADDGSAPIYMQLFSGLRFIVPVSIFNSVVGTLPAAIDVETPT
jgi:hypothetical protein